MPQPRLRQITRHVLAEPARHTLAWAIRVAETGPGVRRRRPLSGRRRRDFGVRVAAKVAKPLESAGYQAATCIQAGLAAGQRALGVAVMLARA